MLEEFQQRSNMQTAYQYTPYPEEEIDTQRDAQEINSILYQFE
jgi:hypothetical protein